MYDDSYDRSRAHFGFSHRGPKKEYHNVSAPPVFPLILLVPLPPTAVINHQPERLKDIARARDNQISFYDARNKVDNIFLQFVSDISSMKAKQFEYFTGSDLNVQHRSRSHQDFSRSYDPKYYGSVS